MQTGSVALVGAGPGQLRLLTLAALEAIRKAEVILYDALLSRDILDEMPEHSLKIYVGKRCGQHSYKQSEINDLLLFHAQSGRRTVRLKGGDPFLFGRGGEELAHLNAHGIQVEVIPGISAFNGLAATHLLPLTMRGGSNEVRLIQGHSLPDEDDYWQQLAAYRGSVGFYMAMNKLSHIMRRLLSHGARPERDVLIVESDDIGVSQYVSQSTIVSLAGQPYQRRSRGPGFVYISDNIKYRPVIETQILPAMLNEETNHEIASANFY